jgi:hypothetical protein
MQDSISNTPDIAKAGQVAYPNAPHFHGTGVFQTSGRTRANLAGRVVSYDSGAGSKGVKAPASSADLTVLTARGIGILRSLQDPTEDPEDCTVGYVKSGFIYVPTEDLLTINTHPYVRVTAAGAEVLGTLRSDSDGGDAVQVTWMKVVEVISSSLALVDVDLSAAPSVASPRRGSLSMSITSLVNGAAFYLPLPDETITITKIKTTVQGATTTTGNAVLTCSINATAITTGVVTIATGAVVGELDECSPTALNVSDGADDVLKVAVTGTQDALSTAHLVIEYTF